MAYKQLVYPDLNTMGNAGWCLWFVEEAFKTPHLYATAIDAWYACNLAYLTSPPSDAMVPVYWTYYDAGQKIEFGHVAISVPGQGIFTSPFNRAYGYEWYSSVQAMTNRLNQIAGANSRYLGWSEDLAGVQLILREQEMPTQQQVYNEFRYWEVPGKLSNGDPSQEQLDYYSAHPWSTLYYDLGRACYDIRKSLEAKQPPNNPQKLGPGIYEV